MECYLDDFVPGRIIIEDGAIVSFRVTCIVHGPLKENRPRTIVIGKNAYVGASAVIMPGVRIGESAAIGAGTVITKDVPAHAIVVGGPVRIIGKVEEEGIMADYAKKRSLLEKKVCC